MARQSLGNRLWYRFVRMLCRMMAVLMLRVRIEGIANEPIEGGVLVVSNHQSHLDPMLAGAACRRPLNFLARESLFRFAPFRWLIQSLDAVPIDRSGMGLSGLRETLRRLRQQEMVMIFPEGTRSPDGELGPLKPGFCALAKRGKVPLLPLGIEGGYHSWPKGRRFPRPGVVRMQFGPILEFEQIQAMDDKQLIEEVRRRIELCHRQARASRHRAMA